MMMRNKKEETQHGQRLRKKQMRYADLLSRRRYGRWGHSTNTRKRSSSSENLKTRRYFFD